MNNILNYSPLFRPLPDNPPYSPQNADHVLRTFGGKEYWTKPMGPDIYKYSIEGVAASHVPRRLEMPSSSMKVLISCVVWTMLAHGKALYDQLTRTKQKPDYDTCMVHTAFIFTSAVLLYGISQHSV